MDLGRIDLLISVSQSTSGVSLRLLGSFDSFCSVQHSDPADASFGLYPFLLLFGVNVNDTFNVFAFWLFTVGLHRHPGLHVCFHSSDSSSVRTVPAGVGTDPSC